MLDPLIRPEHGRNQNQLRLGACPACGARRAMGFFLFADQNRDRHHPTGDAGCRACLRAALFLLVIVAWQGDHLPKDGQTW